MEISCKKTFFINEKSANEFIKKLKKTSVRNKTPVRSYLCEICFNWHLTSQEDKEKLQYERQIKNLKNKIISLELENKSLKRKIEKWE